jgi:predicted RNA-binding protein YlqC (UPF0109 family)
MVNNSDAVEITTLASERSVIFECFVEKEDIGKIIGKQGNNAKAIRVLLNAMAAKHKIRAIFEIIGDGLGEI